jgi:hypothetical protein
VKILTSRTRVLKRRGSSLLILQPCGCRYWLTTKRKLCRHLVQRIRVRVNHGWLQKDIARHLDLCEATVSEALAGKRRYHG